MTTSSESQASALPAMQAPPLHTSKPLQGSPSSQSASIEHCPLLVVVVVTESQGQSSATAPPTAADKQRSASDAVAGRLPFGAQTQSECGAQVARPTATLKMRKQSVAVGAFPFDMGCEQSPFAAVAGEAPKPIERTAIVTSAARISRMTFYARVYCARARSATRFSNRAVRPVRWPRSTAICIY